MAISFKRYYCKTLDICNIKILWYSLKNILAKLNFGLHDIYHDSSSFPCFLLNYCNCLVLGHLKQLIFHFSQTEKESFLDFPNIGTLQPNYDVLKHWGTSNPLIFHLGKMEN